jgi:hypothetical protein
MNLLNDLLALLLSILISSILLMPDLFRISFALIDLMLTYFFFKYANKYISIVPLFLFFFLIQSVYHHNFYNFALIFSLSFIVYTFFYLTWHRRHFRDIEKKFTDLEIKIKEFLNILTAFDYLPNKIKIFDELTNYMKSIFPEIYSIAIFQKSPFGWQCKSYRAVSPTIKNIYLSDLTINSLNKYFLLPESDVLNIKVEVEGDEYIIAYNCVEKPNDRELMEYFFKTLLLLSLRFEKKYFMGLESALVTPDGLIYYDTYKKFAQTLLNLSTNNVVFSMFASDKFISNDFINRVKNFANDGDLIISMSSNKILAIFPGKTINQIKENLKSEEIIYAFAQYPEDGLNNESLIELLEQRIFLKVNDVVIRKA